MYIYCWQSYKQSLDDCTGVSIQTSPLSTIKDSRLILLYFLTKAFIHSLDLVE